MRHASVQLNNTTELLYFVINIIDDCNLMYNALFYFYKYNIINILFTPRTKNKRLLECFIIILFYVFIGTRDPEFMNSFDYYY